MAMAAKVVVDSKMVGSDDDEAVEGKARARATKRTTLINIHDEIYPSIITGPEIYARTTTGI